MLRVESETGWWLITHEDHAHLAADFATHWGNDVFASPTPRENVLHGVRVHDDGWIARDAHPAVTRAGKPSAFSEELVGKYSAFEEIDLAEYLAVREGALDKVEKHCAYAALLVSLHTYNLLTERADRSTIAVEELPLLDAFLARQRVRQEALRLRLRASGKFAASETTENAIQDNFHLLQAMDNLSLYSCVGFMKPGTLLHALPTRDGSARTVNVLPVTARHFRLEPYPFDEPLLTFPLRARHVDGKLFANGGALEERFAGAAVETLTITVSAA